MVGKTLGHYEILEALGAGGMGEVYRARDTTLKRDVAIKVLPPSLVESEDRLARLKHEAHLLAALNHANIATIHALEEEEGTRFLVLELVKGESLEQRLSKGPLPVEKALDVCKQIAEALEAAHEEGIIHRDLKPANVLITPEGRAKVLDFGLAKTAEVAESSEVDISHSPTVTVAGTKTGVILGTAPYMSPEQVRGKPVDKRTDIWAFGCVLYEALTGRRAFNRETVADTLAAIIEVRPDWGALPAATPSLAQSLVRRCLRKDPNRRLHDIADARIEIEEALSEPEAGLPGASPLVAQPLLWRRAALWVTTGCAVGAIVAGLAVWSLMRPTPQIQHYEVGLQSGTHLWGGAPSGLHDLALDRPTRTAMAFSPDGRHLVYAATDGDQSQLYLRAADQERAIPIRDTEGACCPFFSPDGRSVGFYARDEAGRSLRSITLSGGEARTIASRVPMPFGASWGDNDTIVFAHGAEGGLLQVPAGGGTPEPLTEIDIENGETSHRLPVFLPGGDTVLFTVTRGPDVWQDSEIVAQSLETGERKVLIEAGVDARYVPTGPTGYLVFAREGTLRGVPFDPVRLETTGEPVRVREDVMQASFIGNRAVDTGAAQFSFSASGSLAYAPGGVHPERDNPLVWVDRDGEREVIDAGPGESEHLYPRISPDGRYLAYLRGQAGEMDLWVYDLQREAVARRLTSQEDIDSLVWSPDGERIVFGSARDGSFYNLYAIEIGTGEVSRLTTSDDDQYAASWSKPGVLAFVDGEPDVWVVPMEGEGAGEASLFLDSPSWEQWPAFSPDGKWLAYVSNETGRDQVYARPYPGPGVAISISREGGRRPAWSQSGRELFYRETDRRMMVVDIDVTAEGALDPGTPGLLFEGRYSASYPTSSYDVASDGRFAMVSDSEPEPQPVTRINIVLNWFEELKRLVPTGR